MSNNEIIRTWKEADDKDGAARRAPDNPAGEVSLTDEDLGAVAGGTDETAFCTIPHTHDPMLCSGPIN